MVGLANTGIDIIFFTIFSAVFGANYLVSQVIGYGFGTINSFILNRSWTFEHHGTDGKTFQEFLRFCVVNMISLGITLVAMNLFVKNLSINMYISKILVTLIAQITNFLGYKIWVFKKSMEASK